MKVWMVLALILSVGACSNEPPKAEHPPVKQTFDCPNQSPAIDDSTKLRGETEKADVDDDGSEDDLYVQIDSAGELGCQAFLVVETETETVSVPIWEMGASGGVEQPSIRSVVEIDGQPGKEILINEAMGASTQFVAVYSMSDGSLARLRSPEGEDGLFAFGGSLGHLDASDCAEDGTIVISQAVPASTTKDPNKQVYAVKRVFYSSKGNGWKKESTENKEFRIKELDSLPEFGVDPFGSCSTN